ncbi:DUF6602 domain-containing protein [Nocardioides sp. NPDC057767]|uniref:DUF6602 domain-containing protein n=1 Tax=unclassified Nocardioides TaxID=2615069 RepID=UPI0033186A3B
MTSLGDILNATQAKMLADIKANRAALENSTTKGTTAEQFVAAFLRNHLPAGVGVTSGEVIDSAGHRSRQLDVIVYDAIRCPMLFRSAEDNVTLVPIEGVVAVIEVKMALKRADLKGILANCLSVKTMERSAFMPSPDGRRFYVYERVWEAPPPYYSLFAFDSDNMYAGPLNELQLDLPAHHRIDSACYLTRGVNLNSGLELDDEGDSIAPRITASPSSHGFLLDAESNKALLMWFLSLATHISEFTRPPINLLAYARDELNVSGTAPGEGVSERLRARAHELMEQLTGVPSAVFQKIASQEPLTPEEAAAVAATEPTMDKNGEVTVKTLRQRGLR